MSAMTRCRPLSVLTNISRVREQAVQRGLIFRRVEQRLNGVDDFGIEHTPDPNRLSILLLSKPVQKPINRLGFWLKPFESVAINPS